VRDIDTQTHRIGRTGRAGEKGTAYTLVTSKDKEFAGHLVRNLEGANQSVPKELLDLANQNPWFKKNRFEQQKAKKLNIGGSGLGHKERPGLGGSKGGKLQESSISTIQCGGGGGSRGGAMSGPQSDRVATMKSAFANQFKSNFVSATSTAPVNKESSSWTSSSTLDFIPNTAPLDPNSKSGSHSTSAGGQSAPGSSYERPKKKSRWNE